MNYSQFSDALLLGIVEAAGTNPRGQVDVFSVANDISPQVSEQWVRDAVKEFQDKGYFGNLVQPLNGAILCDMTGAARRAADVIRTHEG